VRRCRLMSAACGNACWQLWVGRGRYAYRRVCLHHLGVGLTLPASPGCWADSACITWVLG
jgi:hypothetical protein